jgi:predicted HAD superfamily Cof-like phosphohydrolase
MTNRSDLQSLVYDFHKKFEARIGDEYDPQISDVELRCKLIEEECKEACEAIRSGNLAHAVQELCDVLYVVYGTGVAFGVDLAMAFHEVHRANMSKSKDNKRADGKITKGDSYNKPDIERVLSIAKSRKIGT